MRTSRTRPARSGKNGNRPRIKQISGERFYEMRRACLLSVADAAKLLRVTERTLHNWETGRSRVPYAAYKLLRILRGYELPGQSWAGWMLIRDELVTPEGHVLKASDAAWWSLLATRARYFGVLLDQNRQLRAELEAIRAAATSGAAAAQLVPARDVAILAATLSVDPAAPGAGLPGSIDGILTASCPQFWTFSPPTPEKSPGRRVEAKGPTGNTGQKGQKWVTP